MRQLLRLYAEADSKGIEVYYFPMRSLTAISTPDGTIAMDVDKISTRSEETVLLGHELGHCETGCFYTLNTPLAIWGRCEERANRWAFRRLVPIDELRLALSAGITELHDLAEYFEVTPAFLEKAFRYYHEATALL